MNILLAYDSLSGNTCELATWISQLLEDRQYCYTMVDVALDKVDNFKAFDMMFLGTWTDGYGRTPSDMKAFVEHFCTNGDTPQNVALFGTGETQWGMEVFCGALDRLARFFKTHYPILKIEQMPHTHEDKQAVREWLDQVLDIFQQSKDKMQNANY